MKRDQAHFEKVYGELKVPTDCPGINWRNGSFDGDFDEPILYIITGLPGAGKTTYAEKLKLEAGLPVISRDSLKESLFDSMGHSDREWSVRLGAASWELMWDLTRELMKPKASFILESNFKPGRDESKIVAMPNFDSYRVIQIHCTADRDILFKRFKERVDSGSRHPGHVDHTRIEEMEAFYKEAIDVPLDVPCELKTFDTTELV